MMESCRFHCPFVVVVIMVAWLAIVLILHATLVAAAGHINSLTTKLMSGQEPAWAKPEATHGSSATPAQESVQHDRPSAAEGSTSSLSGKKSSLKSQVRRPWALKFFYVLSFLTIMAAVGVFVAELLCLIFFKERSIPGWVIGLYALVFCLIIVLSELELFHRFTHTFVDHWTIRGIFYVFVGTLVYETKPEHRLNMRENDFIRVVSMALVAAGLIYFALGLFFIKKFRDSMRHKYHFRRNHAGAEDDLRAIETQ